MSIRLFSIAAATALAAQGTAQVPAPGARAVTSAALSAVEGDSAARVGARWSAELRVHPDNRAAALGLATLARLTFQYEDASRRYRALAPAPGARPDLYAVYAKLGESAVLDAQNSTEAGPSAEQARRMAQALGEREAEGEAMAEVAFARVNAQQSIAAGLAGLDTALRLLPGTAVEARAHALRYRALLLTAAQDAAAAAVDSSARALARQAGRRREEAQTYRVEALRLKLAGQPEAGLVALNAAEALHRAARDQSGLALTTAYHAERLADLGRYGAAREVARTALGIAQAARFPAGTASARAVLGGIALRTGDYAEAATALAVADTLFGRQHDPANAVITEGQLAEVSLRAGDLATARARALRLAEWFRSTGEGEGEFGARSLLVTAALRSGDTSDVARRLADVEALARRHHAPPWSAELPMIEGRVALWRGDPAAAARWITRYLATLDTAAHVARHDARVALADAYARRDDLAAAEREMTLAADEVDRWRATLPDDRRRVLAFQATAADPVARDGSVARVLARLATGGRTAAAFALAERRRARGLADRLARAAALAPDARGPVRLDAAPISAGDVRAALPDAATAVVEFVAGVAGAPTTVFVLTREGLRAHAAAPADSLTDAVARLVALLERGDAPAPLERALGAALLDSAVADLGPTVTRLVVVPDGSLHGVPFDALRLADGRYAVERYALGTAPSAAVAAALWGRAANRAASRAPVRLLAFGDPAFAVSGSPAPNGQAPNGRASDAAPRSDDALRAGFAAGGGLARLPGSGAEARDVARYAPVADVRLGADASAAYLTHAALDGYRVLHFATHAIVDESADARSALALAPSDGASGFVTPGELAALHLDADLVVLSACRTAGGALVTGEGVQGLTAPLLAAGARSVVATAWRIADRPTVALVDAFYAALARGLPVSDALRSAQIAAIRRGAPAREWAAFTVVGDPTVRVPLRTPAAPARWPQVAAGAALLLVAGGAAGGAARARRRTTG